MVIAHDVSLLTSWDHTANIIASLHNLNVTVLNLASKSKAKPRSAAYFHPFRESKPQGLKVNAKNIGVLKFLIGCMGR